MSLMIRNQQPSPPPQVESGKPSSRFWCVQCQQPGDICYFCMNGQNSDQRMNDNPLPQNQRGQGQNQNQYGQGNSRGPIPRGQTNQNVERKEYHQFCGRYLVRGQCWSDNQNYGCSNCSGSHHLDECRQPDKLLVYQTLWLIHNNKLKSI